MNTKITAVKSIGRIPAFNSDLVGYEITFTRGRKTSGHTIFVGNAHAEKEVLWAELVVAEINKKMHDFPEIRFQELQKTMGNGVKKTIYAPINTTRYQEFIRRAVNKAFKLSGCGE